MKPLIEWLMNQGLSYEEILVACTFVMVVLTVFIILLTAIVVWYTCKTLHVTKKALNATNESLDFFAKPIFEFKGEERKEQECSTGPQTFFHLCSELLLNESALDIVILNKKDIRFKLRSVKPETYFKKVSSGFVGPRKVLVDGLSPIGYPVHISKSLSFQFKIQWEYQDTPELKEPVEVVVKVSVDYLYRNRPYKAGREVTYTLLPPK